MTEYLMAVWHDDAYEMDFSTEQMRRVVPQVDRFNDDLRAAGAWVFGGGLHPASSSTVVRPDDGGGVSMTDGPYAESKEQIGGFWVIETTNLDTALKWGRRAAVACEGPVEIRPFESA